MRPFDYETPPTAIAAVGLAEGFAPSHATSLNQYVGGGTTLLDLMKLDVMRPARLVDITRLEDKRLRQVAKDGDMLRIGALVTMSALSDDRMIARDYPVLRDTLWQAASAQLRNMARLGGNVLQRTRCPYFRDTTYEQCNKRDPGSGCAAMDGFNRLHAVLGTSGDCIATYPGDWAQALIALDANVEILGTEGPRVIRFAELHRAPGATPHIETTLAPGDLITGFTVPGGPWPRSTYVKVRDRASYAFANASAAVALRMDGDAAADVRIALGGVATVPWRARKAEALLKGRPLTEEAATAAAEAEFADATAREHNAFKIPLGKATIVRALMQAKAMEA
ncbi:FAD-binding molybdopterin dehydrogenase [Altererythrobacter sp. B11]|uniref:FAD binding domain-containing protein n=1 Tax=Altererythrobacter sp. B11 TaxID=2060312 RepID=UPI000DC72040|nr:xanthine dehydrogenase family protein subunit M [Altererythrobacter sp. B11]BBC72588.1 FAD-binding molybdopterin dehydrogenase [Altererythrobacter sp. B11]